MDWASEDYVRLYTRNTVTWISWPWQTRALFPLVIKACGRDGVLDADGHGLEAIAILLMVPLDFLEAGLAGAQKTGTLSWDGRRLVVVNYGTAQYAARSESARKKEERSRAKSRRDSSSPAVTDSHEHGHGVTPTDIATRNDCGKSSSSGRHVTPTDVPSQTGGTDGWEDGSQNSESEKEQSGGQPYESTSQVRTTSARRPTQRPLNVRRLEEGQWRQTFEDAVAAAQGAPYALSGTGMRDLDTAIDRHAPGGAWEARRTWLADVVGRWVSWRKADAKFRPGTSSGFLGWLNEGGPPPHVAKATGTTGHSRDYQPAISQEERARTWGKDTEVFEVDLREAK